MKLNIRESHDMLPIPRLWEAFSEMPPESLTRVKVAFGKPGIGYHKREIAVPKEATIVCGVTVHPAFALATFINNRAVALGAQEVIVSSSRLLFEELLAMFDTNTPFGYGYLIGFMEAVYGSPMTLISASAETISALPDPKLLHLYPRLRGGEFIGIDLGRSDVKVAHVRDGAFVRGVKRRWAPEKFTRIGEHVDLVARVVTELMGGQWDGSRGGKLGSEIDSIGLSTAGVVQNGSIRISGLFSGLTESTEISRFGEMLSDKLGGKRVAIIHDGDAAMLQAKIDGNYRGGILGISLGSGVGVGCINARGELEGLNETGKAVLDFHPLAPVHNRYGFRGAAIFYLSQNAPFRIAESLGFTPDDPSQRAAYLESIKEKTCAGEAGFNSIPKRIGAYLADSVPEFLDIYADSGIENIVLYGRVVSGEFGRRIIAAARKRLSQKYPRIAETVKIGFPEGIPRGMDSESNAELGQAVAAAYYAALTDN